MNYLRIFLFTLFLLLGHTSYSQLVKQASPTYLSLYGVDFYDEMTGYACGGNVVKTSDGGDNWSLVSYSGVNAQSFNSSIFYNVKTFSPQKIILFGQDNFLNVSRIFTTNDGGITWNDVSLMLPGNGLRAAYFPNLSTGYAVGLGGTIYKTLDGGGTWTDIPNNMFYDFTGVYFTSALTGFVVGKNVVIKTIDGGSSWQTTYFQSAQLNAITFEDSNVGYISASDGKIYKTINNGVTWVELNLPFTRNTTIQSWSKDTLYAVSNSCVQVSNNGGICWDKFPLEEFNAIDLVSSKIGYGVGYNGIIYKFINNVGVTKPVSHFTYPSKTGCEGKSMKFTNQGNPLYSYQWLLNNTLISTSYSTDILFSTSGTQTVKLIAYNNFFYDTSLVDIYIQAKPVVLPFNSVVLIDTICPNNFSIIEVPLSQIGVLYNLRIGNVITTTSGTVNGTGNTLRFYTPYIQKTTVFNIRGWCVSDCDTTEYIQYDTIHVNQIADPSDVVKPTANTICPKTSTFIEVHDSDPGIWYRLNKNGIPMNDSMMGNGSVIKLSTDVLYTTSSFTVTARNSNDCRNQLTSCPTVSVTPISADFNVTNNLTIVGDTLIFDNSLVKGDSLFWFFGSNAHFISDTAYNPMVFYDSIGIHTITLISKTSNLCYDTVQKDISIYNLASSGKGKMCMGNIIPHSYNYPGYKTLSFHVDENSNTYLGGYIENTSGFDGEYYDMFLIKADPEGNVVWEKNQNFPHPHDTYKSSFITGITSDTTGNVYITGSIAGKLINMDTIDLESNNHLLQGYVAKLSPSGVTQWVVRLQSDSPYGFGGGSDIFCTSSGDLFVSFSSTGNWAGDTTKLIMPDKSITFLPSSQSIYLIKFDVNGKFKKVNTAKNSVHSVYNPNGATYYTNRIATVSPKIKMNSNGKIFVVGSFGHIPLHSEQFVIFGGHKIDTITEGINGFVAILDTALGWQNAFTTYGLEKEYEYNFSRADEMIPVFTIDDSDNVYIGTTCNYTLPNNNFIPFIKFNNGIKVIGDKHHIMKYDAQGKLLWNKENSKFFARSFDITLQNEILLFGEFKNFLGFGSPEDNPLGIGSLGDYDIFFAGMDLNGEIKWARNMGSKSYENALFMKVDRCSNDFCFSGMLGVNQVTFDNFHFVNSNNSIFISRYSPDAICATNLPCFGQIVTPVNKESALTNLFTIYPNPTSGTIYIECLNNKYDLNIYNSIGQNLLSQKIGINKSKFDLSNQPNGIYFLQLRSEKQVLTQKLIISR